VLAREVLTKRAEQARAPRSIAVHDRGPWLFALATVAVLGVSVWRLPSGTAPYSPGDWLPLMIAVALLAAVACVWGPSLRLSRTQKILLGLFVLQALWTAASMLWAWSASNAWQETNRTLFYVLAAIVVFSAVRWTGPKALLWSPEGWWAWWA